MGHLLGLISVQGSIQVNSIAIFPAATTAQLISHLATAANSDYIDK